MGRDVAELVQAARAITTGNRTPSRHRALRLDCRMQVDGTTCMTPTTSHLLQPAPPSPMVGRQGRPSRCHGVPRSDQVLTKVGIGGQRKARAMREPPGFEPTPCVATSTDRVRSSPHRPRRIRRLVQAATIALLLSASACSQATDVGSVTTGLRGQHGHGCYVDGQQPACTTTTLPPVSACHHGTVSSHVAINPGVFPSAFCLWVGARYHLVASWTAPLGSGPNVGPKSILIQLPGAMAKPNGFDATFLAVAPGVAEVVVIFSPPCWTAVPRCSQADELWDQRVEVAARRG